MVIQWVDVYVKCINNLNVNGFCLAELSLLSRELVDIFSKFGSDE